MVQGYRVLGIGINYGSGVRSFRGRDRVLGVEINYGSGVEKDHGSGIQSYSVQGTGYSVQGYKDRGYTT